MKAIKQAHLDQYLFLSYMTPGPDLDIFFYSLICKHRGHSKSIYMYMEIPEILKHSHLLYYVVNKTIDLYIPYHCV